MISDQEQDPSWNADGGTLDLVPLSTHNQQTPTEPTIMDYKEYDPKVLDQGEEISAKDKQNSYAKGFIVVQGHNILRLTKAAANALTITGEISIEQL